MPEPSSGEACARLVVGDLAMCPSAEHIRVQGVLEGKHARAQRYRRLFRGDRESGLGDDRAAIDGVGDQVHRGTVDTGPGCQGAAVGIEPRECGQKRGVDVEQAAPVMVYEIRAQDPQKAGQRNDVGREPIECRYQGAFKGRARGKQAMIDDVDRKALSTRVVDGRCRGVVAHDPDDPIAIFGGLFLQGAQIAAAPRNHDSHLQRRF